MNKRNETNKTMMEMEKGITGRSTSEPDGGGDVRGEVLSFPGTRRGSE
jgi:hypothetical protein